MIKIYDILFKRERKLLCFRLKDAKAEALIFNYIVRLSKISEPNTYYILSLLNRIFNSGLTFVV